MAKIAIVGVLVVVIFGISSNCQTANIDDLLGDPEVVSRQIACVLEKGPCDALGKSLKASLKEVLGNGCGRCNSKQKMNARKITDFIKQNYELEWQKIVEKYLPNSHRRNF